MVTTIVNGRNKEKGNEDKEADIILENNTIGR